MMHLVDCINTIKIIIRVFHSKTKNRIEEQYRWEKITDQYEDLFKTLKEWKSGEE